MLFKYSKNKASDNIGFTTMDKNFFDDEFRYTDGKVAFSSRENGMKVIVSRAKTNKILCRLMLGIDSKNVCVDHKYHCIWLNDSFCISSDLICDMETLHIFAEQ